MAVAVRRCVDFPDGDKVAGIEAEVAAGGPDDEALIQGDENLTGILVPGAGVAAGDGDRDFAGALLFGKCELAEKGSERADLVVGARDDESGSFGRLPAVPVPVLDELLQGLFEMRAEMQPVAFAVGLYGLGDALDSLFAGTQGLAGDYELHLASAIIGKDGTFERNRVTLRHPERTVTLSEGSWGGLLSRRQDTDGNPRLVAGFSSVEFRESDGSEGEFVGSLLGLSDTFRQNGTSGPLPGSGR